jgi:hypothetical protein
MTAADGVTDGMTDVLSSVSVDGDGGVVDVDGAVDG